MPPASEGRQRLEHDAVREQRGDVGGVVRRRDLDDVDADDRKLEADAPHGVEQLARRQPTGLGRTGPRRHARVHDVDVDREEDPHAVCRRGRDLIEAHRQSPRADLGHLVGAHPLLGHPGERLRPGPVAAQTQLEEPVTAHGTGLDQPAHRLAVPVERAELDVAGVRVGVEVHDGHPAVAVPVGDTGDVRPRDGVVTAEHERQRACRRDPGDRLTQSVE